VIRAGDRVTVDQETQVLHARFQAVALESAAVGQRMKVRLGTGTHSAQGLDGTVIAVLATAAGQAQWLTVERIGR
jgi:flagella basal body P-ring formation protein FlgA